MNEELEQRFVNFTNEYLSFHHILPKYCEIKCFFDALGMDSPGFKASKGWFEKFIWRNYKTSPRYHYKKMNRKRSSGNEWRSDSKKSKNDRRVSLLKIMEDVLAKNRVHFDRSGMKGRESESVQGFGEVRNERSDKAKHSHEFMNLSKMSDAELWQRFEGFNEETKAIPEELSDFNVLPDLGPSKWELDKEQTLKDSIFDNKFYVN